MTLPYTTLARIRAHYPCEHGYKKLVKHLGGARTYDEHTPITVRQLVESNGLDDALWCLRTMPEHDPRWRLLAALYARRVQRMTVAPRRLSPPDDELPAARAVSRAAEWAAWAAWVAAGADSEAARAAEREWQAQELLRICEEPIVSPAP